MVKKNTKTNIRDEKGNFNRPEIIRQLEELAKSDAVTYDVTKMPAVIASINSATEEDINNMLLIGKYQDMLARSDAFVFTDVNSPITDKVHREMNNVKIYVCCHKDYEPVGIDNPCYCIISDKDIKNGSSLPFVKSDGFLENRIWSELSHIYYVWKHPELQADWVGFCHYRRYFEFMNDIPELTKPIIPQPLNLSFNNFMSYFVNHNAYDLMQVLTLMKKKESPYIREALMMCDSHT